MIDAAAALLSHPFPVLLLVLLVAAAFVKAGR